MHTATAEEGDWSAPDHGLRARLIVLPSLKDDPFYRIYIELDNVDEVMGQKQIPFSPEKCSFKVTNEKGDELKEPHDLYSYDGISPNWTPLSLPMGGTIKFRIDTRGLSCGDKKNTVVDLGIFRAWIIPQDGSNYFLSAKFTIPRDPHAHPIMDWHGTLDLPKVKIPAAP